jgi:hypothetical protein
MTSLVSAVTLATSISSPVMSDVLTMREQDQGNIPRYNYHRRRPPNRGRSFIDKTWTATDMAPLRGHAPKMPGGKAPVKTSFTGATSCGVVPE